jgi:subtilisin-like proprotein convertase family protein
MQTSARSRRRAGTVFTLLIAVAFGIVMPPAASTQQEIGKKTNQEWVPVEASLRGDLPGIGASTTTHSSGPLSLPIPDNGTTTNTISVGPAYGMVADLNVRVRINHTFVGDLTLFLTSPTGVSVPLALKVGASGINYGSGAANCTGTFTEFDDEAPTYVDTGSPPFAGGFKPVRPLAIVDGLLAPGTWTLTISDTAGDDVGTLFCWEMALTRHTPPANYFQDIRTDLALFRPSTGQWFIRAVNSTTPALASFGQNGDIPVIGNAGVSSTNTPTVFRPSTGQWFVGSFTPIEWGLSGDVPVPGDYDANGVTDIAVWRPSLGVWFVRNVGGFVWGTSGDVPVPADYLGGPATDLAVWRPSNGAWFIAGADPVVWGAAGDICVPANYLGDEKAEIAVYRPSNGTWHIRGSASESRMIQFGINGDIPVPADYNGDGTDDIAVYRPSEGRWHIRNFGVVQFGTAEDIPLMKRPTYPGYPY